MKTVIIYESIYGNTRQVADELAAVAGENGEVHMVPAERADRASLDGADLVLIGGPTHCHGMSSKATRRSGRSGSDAGVEVSPGPDVPGPGLRDWFRVVGMVDGVSAAAFDTRLDGPELMTGRASVGIGRRLRHYGFTEVAAPRSFLVTRDNHLVDGETERAHQWAESVFESLLVDMAH